MRRELIHWAETTLEDTQRKKLQVWKQDNPSFGHPGSASWLRSWEYRTWEGTQVLLIKASICPSDPTWHFCARYQTFVRGPRVSLWGEGEKIKREEEGQSLKKKKNLTHSGSVRLLLLESEPFMLTTTTRSKKSVHVWDKGGSGCVAHVKGSRGLQKSTQKE